MSTYDVVELGGLDTWRSADDRPGKQFVDKLIPTQFVGVSANTTAPGEQSPFWHSHDRLEEVYIFLDGLGQMGLDDDVVDVKAGTVVRVGQGVMRILRALPDSPEDLRWLCVRAGGDTLENVGHDGQLDRERPAPWAK